MPVSKLVIHLVERDAALRSLDESLASVAKGTGRTVVIAGEAGIGKTSLLQALAARRGEAELWWGNCDALQTPHPLAPLHDIARSADVTFHSLLAADDGRAALFEAVLTELAQRRRPTLVVIEDVHWADDATFDLIKFLGRRIDRAACLLVISYRDDEVTASHPLRLVLGELPPSFVTRVDLPRLSIAGVELLARRALRSPAGIYGATRGNPFFVIEMLRDGIDGVPRSVQDLVLARFARLSPPAQAIVRLASVVPGRIERRIIDELLVTEVVHLEECLNSGLLTAADSALSFRHELARVAIETSLSEPAARALHAGVLAVLAQVHAPPAPLARLVHHAARAGDSNGVLRYAPQAAHQAQQRGAHREAAAHYCTALLHAAAATDAQRAELLEAYAHECQWTDQLNEAIAARLQLSELLRSAGDPDAEAQNLSTLALVYVLASRNAKADAASRTAIELLEALPPSAALAGAYRVEAHLRMLDRDCEASVAWSTKAIEAAQQFEHREIIAAALCTRGTAMLFIDYDDGVAQLLQALQLAHADGLTFIAANILTNLGSGSGELFRLREARQYLEQAISFAHEHEIDCYRTYSMAWLALCEMYLGRWDDAAEHASEVIGATTDTAGRIMALVARGRLQARRGETAASATLDEALELARATNTLQRLAPVRAARAEAAYLRGDVQAASEEAQLPSMQPVSHRHLLAARAEAAYLRGEPSTAVEARPALMPATSNRHPWFAGDLAYWMHKSGTLDGVPVACAEPFALQLAGRWREAATCWENLGCPYEQARALTDGTAEAQQEALTIFERLGARPAADDVRRKLRAAGQRGLPRGIRASTQANPHDLTDREFEVLLLLCEGLKNSEIAERLCRSVRTVDHHVAAAFAKLGVSSRAQAIATVLRTDIRSQNGFVTAAK